jgi:hypothetical protein
MKHTNQKPTVEKAFLLGETIPDLEKVNVKSSTYLFLLYNTSKHIT